MFNNTTPAARRTRTARTLLSIAAACLVAVACNANTGDASANPGTSITAVDQAGDTLHLSRPASRVVSVLPSVNEFLLAMDAGSLIAARTNYDVQPELAHLPSIGGGLDPSLEVLLSLGPDLVVTWHGPAHDRLRNQLRAAGIATFGVGTQDTAEVFRSLHALGQLTGRSRAADSLTGSIRAEFARVAESVRNAERPTVLYALSVNPPMTTGPRTYVSELIGVAGGVNVFGDLDNDFPVISLEEIVRRNPAFVLLPADSANAAARIRTLQNTPGWKELRAVREQRVITIPSNLLDRPGPHMGVVARLIRNALHPEAAGQ